MQFVNIIFSISFSAIKAKVQFSLGGAVFSRRAVSYTYMPDTVLENARNVTIHLHHHIAKYIKIQLHFASRWIMISEVIFESGN
ncbi:unnamed protein product [Nezara viridula]|uniref:Discoidin domain-containing protein n=1 Tax=Nezara viridula TaxID=85310 RepID=A0A9P0H0J5_NEZVI|nr:unnamed protein product [Nezara viridula]